MTSRSTSSVAHLRDRTFLHCTDEALIVRIARGDEAAFAELYDRLGKLAYSLALRILRNASLAEEATQEAFLAVWRGAARFDARRATARAWVLLQVRARAIDRVRHEERRGGAGVELDTELHESTAVAPADEAWMHLERERLEAALKTIPDPERELIELAYFEGYSQSELATRLGLPLGTVKRRTFNALARLRDLLQDDR